MLRSRWTLEDVDDVEGLVGAAIDRYLRRRGAYLDSEQRDDLHAYLLGQVWILYRKFDPSKASTSLSLSTYLTRRLGWATTDWYRQFYGDSRYKRAGESTVALELTIDTELEPGREDAHSELPSLSDTGLERWARFGLLRAAGYNYGEIAERTGMATGEIGAEIKALRNELNDNSSPG